MHATTNDACLREVWCEVWAIEAENQPRQTSTSATPNSTMGRGRRAGGWSRVGGRWVSEKLTPSPEAERVIRLGANLSVATACACGDPNLWKQTPSAKARLPLCLKYRWSSIGIGRLLHSNDIEYQRGTIISCRVPAGWAGGEFDVMRSSAHTSRTCASE